MDTITHEVYRGRGRGRQVGELRRGWHRVRQGEDRGISETSARDARWGESV